MEKSYIPEGFMEVTPCISVKDADKCIEFLVDVLEGKLIARYADENDRIMNAIVRIGASTIELSDANEQWPARPAACHVYVPDVDAAYERALKAGAKSLGAPTDKHYGERGAELEDEFGNHWYIATVK
ncbi:MAG: VOC family protein [Candidatus Gracilibacteria bacterium]